MSWSPPISVIGVLSVAAASAAIPAAVRDLAAVTPTACRSAQQIGADIIPARMPQPEPARGDGNYRRDPAPDFAGKGKWPQMRYADDGGHPSKYGNIITSKWALPCCRCQTIIEAGQPLGGNLVTGTIHGDPAMCKMKKRRASR